MVIIPELTIGEPDTDNLAGDAAATPTLVTVPAPVPPPTADIVILPVFPDRVIPVPAVNDKTPELVISTSPVVELEVTLIPVFPVNVLYGLAFPNSVAKFVLTLLKAVYSESLPTDSFCAPIFITCNPEIAIFCPYYVFIIR
jgi:hypothetical protein